MVLLDPGCHDRLELLVAGERIAERPFAYGRQTGFGRAIRVNDGLQLVIELRRDGLVHGAVARPRDREHLVALDQTADGLEAFGFKCLCIVADQLDRQTTDPALGVDFLDRHLHRDLAGLTPLGAFAGQRSHAANLDVTSRQLGGFSVERRRHAEYDGHDGHRCHKFTWNFHC